MREPAFWKSHYLVETPREDIEATLRSLTFTSDNREWELLSLPWHGADSSILISPGSGGHAFVFVELAYRLRTLGYTVYVMPKHGAGTVSQLVTRHRDALDRIRATGCGRIAIYGEGLGGYLAFYVAFLDRSLAGVVCENSPAILTEVEYHWSLLHDSGPWTKAARRRRRLLPLLGPLALVFPRLPIPIAAYLPWADLVDSRPGSREREERLVREGYLQDPDFDRWYPLSAVMSLLTTPPPERMDELSVPVMFILASEGPTPSYVQSLFDRVPSHPKKLVRVNGSVYWMLSHPQKAALTLADWLAGLP